MPDLRLLYLTQHQLVAYRWTAGVLKEEASFEPSEAANTFVEYLQSKQKSLFALIANVGEEGFQVDTIPFLQASDRTAVIERKLKQLFQGAALSVAISLGFEKSRRKDERLLFTALNNASMFEPWLLALKTAETCLSGIYSVSMLSEAIVARMQLPRERCLLVTVQDTSLRQTFFDRGHLYFSRLSPLANSSISGISQAIASEAAKTQQYLLSQRFITRNDVLSVHVLAHPQAIPAISTTGTDTLRFQIHNLHDVAQKIGLKTLPQDSRADHLYLHSAAATPPKAQFAREPMRQEYRLWQIGNALRAVGAIAFAGCVLFAGRELVEVVYLHNRAEIALVAASSSDQRYQAIVRTFPPVPVDNTALRQITSKVTELIRQEISPAGMYSELSLALASAPQIEIDAIEWRTSGAPEKGGGGRNLAVVATTTTEPQDFAVVRGTVQLGRNPNPRDILRVFDSFIAALKANPHITLTVEQQPFDTGTEKSLKSSESANALSAPRPFSIIITRKLAA